MVLRLYGALESLGEIGEHARSRFPASENPRPWSGGLGDTVFERLADRPEEVCLAHTLSVPSLGSGSHAGGTAESPRSPAITVLSRASPRPA